MRKCCGTYYVKLFVFTSNIILIAFDVLSRYKVLKLIRTCILKICNISYVTHCS
jgi:hypothetical protein